MNDLLRVDEIKKGCCHREFKEILFRNQIGILNKKRKIGFCTKLVDRERVKEASKGKSRSSSTFSNKIKRNDRYRDLVDARQLRQLLLHCFWQQDCYQQFPQALSRRY